MNAPRAWPALALAALVLAGRPTTAPERDSYASGRESVVFYE